MTLMHFAREVATFNRLALKLHSAGNAQVTGCRHRIDHDGGFASLNLSTVPMRTPGMRC